MTQPDRTKERHHAGAHAPPGDSLSYQAFFDQLGIAIYQTTLDGRVVRCNEAVATLFGFASAGEVAATLDDVAHQVYVDARDRHVVLDQALRTGNVGGYVLQMRRRDGSVFWASLTCTLVKDAKGAPAWLIGSVTDISNVIQQRDQLVAAERDYRAIFDNATVAIFRATPDGRILRANAAFHRLFGEERDDPLGAAHVDPARREAFRELLAHEGRVVDFEIEMRRPLDGQRFWSRATVWTVLGEDDRPAFHEGFVQDITAERLADEAIRAKVEAERASAAKDDFLANMSHELRTPLNAIIGFTELMLRETHGPLGSERYRRYLSMVLDAGGHLLGLISDILDLSRHRAGKTTLEEEDVPLPTLLDGIVAMFELRAREAQITLAVAGAQPDLWVRGDRRRLKQVLLNLVSNALKFTEPGGRIDLRLSIAPEGAAVIEVEDTGVGIDPAHLQSVFEPFVQLRANAMRADNEGTGLGLALARKLVEAHDGTIVLESMVGEGTTAIITLPRSRVVTPAQDLREAG